MQNPQKILPAQHLATLKELHQLANHALRIRDHGHATGWLWACYMVLAGAERFLVETVRAKDDRLLGSFTLAQATSIALILLGGVLLYVWREPAGPQPLPESLRPKQVPLRA